MLGGSWLDIHWCTTHWPITLGTGPWGVSQKAAAPLQPGARFSASDLPTGITCQLDVCHSSTWSNLQFFRHLATGCKHWWKGESHIADAMPVFRTHGNPYYGTEEGSMIFEWLSCLNSLLYTNHHIPIIIQSPSRLRKMPKNLKSLTFGSRFNQPLDSVPWKQVRDAVEDPLVQMVKLYEAMAWLAGCI